MSEGPRAPTRRLTAVGPPAHPVWAVLVDLWGIAADVAAVIPVRFVPVPAFGLIEQAGIPTTHAVALLAPDDALCCMHGPEFPDPALIAADATLDARHGYRLLALVHEDPHPENYRDQAWAAWAAVSQGVER